MIIIQHGGLPLVVNPSHIELVINNDDYALLYMSNHRQTATEIKYARFKTILPEYFIEIDSPSMKKSGDSNFKGMLNPKLISEIGWNKTFNPKWYVDKLLVYTSKMPRSEKWSEDKTDSDLDFIGVHMFSGAYIPVTSGLMEMVSVIEKKTVKEMEKTVLCPDII